MLPAVYTGSNVDPIGESITIGFDSSIFVTGTSAYTNDSVFIIKTDMNGVILNQIQLPGSMSSLEKTKDSSFFSLYKKTNISNEITTLIKWSQNLDTLWTKSIQLNAEIKSIHLSEIIDSNILISGVIGPNNSSFVIITDSLGTPIWMQTFESPNVPNLNFSLSKQQSGTTILVVSSNSSKTTNMLIDINGNIIWTKYYENFVARDFVIDSQKNIFIGGDNGVVILDSIGTFLNGKTILSGNHQFYTIKNYMDTLIAFAYGSTAWDFGGWNDEIHILDDSLNFSQSIKYFGGFNDFDIRDSSVYSLTNGPLVGVKSDLTYPHFGIEATIRPNNSCGYSNNFQFSTLTLIALSDSITYAVITPSDTTTSTNLYPSTLLFEANCIGFIGSVDENEESQIKIYPNPSTGIITIESEESKMLEKIEVLSTDGRVVFTKDTPKNSSTSINLNKLPPGIYYLKAKLSNSFIVKKIIRQ